MCGVVEKLEQPLSDQAGQAGAGSNGKVQDDGMTTVSGSSLPTQVVLLAVRSGCAPP